VYGGPGPQRVSDNWHLRVDLRAQLLAQMGFLVIRCDNRGSARRGKKFEAAIKWNMGDIEVRDQVHACQMYAKSGSYSFPERIAGEGAGIVDLEKVCVYVCVGVCMYMYQVIEELPMN
jgi:dipeptidyl aminopeptidase/acylaminoacyl peptidase